MSREILKEVNDADNMEVNLWNMDKVEVWEAKIGEVEARVEDRWVEVKVRVWAQIEVEAKVVKEEKEATGLCLLLCPGSNKRKYKR